MSNLVDHARRELAILNPDDDMGFNDSIIKVMEAFSEYSHSGGSASAAIPIINDLLQFKSLTPLTDNPDEWMEVGEGVWQSKRNSEAFSVDGGKTHYHLSELDLTIQSEKHDRV